MLKNKLQRQKPWAVMGMSRKQYQAKKPWKSAKGKMTKEQFEEMILNIAEAHPNFYQELKEEADAEKLVSLIFGED